MLRIAFVLYVFCTVSIAVAGDLHVEMASAAEALTAITPELGQLITDGHVEQANQKLVAFFPAENRTAGQALVLANMLYDIDPKQSYALHKEAIAKAPHEMATLIEWGMEQHRAGEYEGALAAYDEYSQIAPQDAPVHGLAADCLMRLGKTQSAIARWAQSENAKSGTLENFESLVCAVYKPASPHTRRSELLAKLEKGDAGAAAELIVLDCDWPSDWWNKGPQESYLAHDVPLVQKLPESLLQKAMLCASELYANQEMTADEASAVFLRYGLLIDPAHTLPENATLASLLFSSAFEHKLLTTEKAKEQFGPALPAKAKTSKDGALWNLVANFYEGDPQLADLELQAWDATGEARFAAGYLDAMLQRGELKSFDPRLAQAIKQFPEDSMVNLLAASVLAKDAKITPEFLINAIKSEYRHFSFNGPLSPRPGARPLRSYFHELDKLSP